MPVPHSSGNFGDLLDPRFQQIFQDQFRQLPDMIPTLFDMEPTNGRNNMTWSEVGALGDFSEFNGSVSYDSINQGYDVTSTPLEFASGIQVERKLFDDDQFNIMNQRPRELAIAAQRTRQKHASRVFNNAFSVDTKFYNHSEGVALCSDSHTTTAQGVSTSSGFDNLATAALSATAVTAARIQMVGFRDDRGNRIQVTPDEIWYPPDLYDVALEIVRSTGKPDTAENNVNVHSAQYTPREWNYMTDTNNWFLADSTGRRMWLKWTDRIPLEFAMAEDLDTIIAKWRAYMRYSYAWLNWRWVIGHQVS